MREIKFRAWDEEFKTMRYNAVVGIDNSDQKMDIGLHGGSSATGFTLVIGRWSDPVTWKYFPVMEYTGLKDKSGKEIFEGDIIEFDMGEVGIETGVVRFSNQGFWTSQAEGTAEEILSEELHSLESKVIGNIYELK